MEEIQSIKIPNFSVSQCDSLSGLYVQRENPSLKCLFCLYALIYISHCSWEEVAGKYLTLTAHGFILKKRYIYIYISPHKLSFKFKNTSCYTHIVLTFSPLIFTKYDPCLHILITQVATYTHAMAVFFLLLLFVCICFWCTEA